MNILHAMHIKQHISFKDVTLNFKHDAIKVESNHLMNFLAAIERLSDIDLKPFAYTARKNHGWLCDYYIIPKRIVLQHYGKALVSQDFFVLATGGYSLPNSFKVPNPKSVYEINNLASSAIEVICREANPTLEHKQLYINELLLAFADLVANN